MDELAQVIAQRTGLPQDKAQAAAQVAIDFIKSKLPPPIAAQVDAALKGGNVGNVAQDLGGMLGKK